MFRSKRPIIAIVLLLLFGLFSLNLYTRNQRQKVDLAYLESYLSSATKHGTFVFSRKYATSGSVPEENAEFWVKNKQVRLDMLGAGGKRQVITPNETPYLCGRPLGFGQNICSPAVIPAETYLLGFTKVAGSVKNLGADRAQNCTKYRYELKQTFSQPGASNTYYVDDITYCLAGGEKLVYTTYRGYIPEKEGLISDPNQMDVGTYTFKSIETGVEIPNSLFLLPYPVQKENSTELP